MSSSPIADSVVLAAIAGDRTSEDVLGRRMKVKASFVSSKLTNTHIAHEELQAICLLHGVEALKTWDPSLAKFETHCQLRMWYGLTDDVGGHYIGATIPGSQLQKYWSAMDAAEDDFYAASEIAGLASGMRPATFMALYEMVNNVKPAHLVAGVGFEGAVPGEDGDSSEGDFVYDSDINSVFEDELLESLDLTKLLEVLSSEQRYLVRAFIAEDRFTDIEIGEATGLSRKQVKRRRDEALEILRGVLEANPDAVSVASDIVQPPRNVRGQI
jgi:hypothetical protein